MANCTDFLAEDFRAWETGTWSVARPRWFICVFLAVGVIGEGETGSTNGEGDLGAACTLRVGTERESLGLAVRASILSIDRKGEEFIKAG